MNKEENITSKYKLDISDLKSGISEANKQIKLANAQFKAATSGMDEWNQSSDGLNAKIKQLGSILNSETSKLSNYNKQLEAIENSESENIKKAEELKAKLRELANQGVSKTSEEYKQYQRALNNVEKEQESNRKSADNLKITILNQEAAVGRTQKELKNYQSALGDVGKEATNTEESVEDLNDGFTVMKGALASLIADGIRRTTQAMKEFVKESINIAAAIKAENSMFEQTFGDMADEAEAAIKRVANATDILDTRLNVAGSRLYAFARSNGGTVAESMELMETALLASADSAAYYDKSLEETTDTMMSFLKGNFANDAALGISATEFTRNAKATELFGKKYTELNEIQKQQTLLKMVTDSQKLSGAMGQAAREADGWENIQGNLNETWRQFQGQVGTPILEALIPIIQNITKSLQEWTEKINWNKFGKNVQKNVQKIIDVFNWFIKNRKIFVAAIKGMLAAFVITKVASFASIIVTLIKTISSAPTRIIGMTNALKSMNAVAMSNPYIALAAGIIGLVVAISSYAKKTSEASKAIKEENEAIEEQTDAITENRNSWNELQKEKQNSINAGMSELAYYQSLYDELNNIVDANGKVKKGYEGRASFITTTLSEALGIELKLVDGVIKGYEKVSESIDKVMEKKKAMIILESQEELYSEAINKQQDALQELNKIKAEIIENDKIRDEMLEEYQKAIATGNFFEKNLILQAIEQHDMQTAEYLRNYKEQESLLEEYAYNVGLYEKNMSLYHEEKYSEMSTVSWNYVKNMEQVGDAEKAQLENQIKNVETNLQILKGMRNDSNADILDGQIKASEKQLEQLNKDLNKYTSTAETKMDSFSSKIIAKINNNYPGAMSAGENIILGINQGISNKNKQNNVFATISNFGKKMLAELKGSLKEHSPSKATEEMGEFLIDGIPLGVKKKEKSTLEKIRDFGKSIITTLQDELNENVEIQNLTTDFKKQLGDIKGVASNLSVPTLNSNAVNSGVSESNSIQNSNVTNFTQINNSPKPLSRAEVYRQTKNVLALVRR